MTKWIPVSEELPKMHERIYRNKPFHESDWVLITHFYKNQYKVSKGFYDFDKKIWYRKELTYYPPKVVAWMPIPKPYKPESEE